ncbi:XF1762 family protein [Aquamicrobium sp.]|uniref:XF1762 family protein n=1 Tax=Aquamicrobium sp. TaxID=1872579 RepID=UPI00258D2498|nr:XF1762 family protein [Aquamicrobium sp.]MCK9549167.1 hypothetical protein [Aquamicrobium sp.]
MSKRIVPLTLREANDFVEQWHRHSSRTSNDGGKFAIGMEHNGQLVGVAIVGRPVARLLQVPGAAEVLRLCTSPAAPKGAASKLYARCRRIWQQMGGTTLHTYTLKRESGASLRGAGIHEPSAEVEPQQWDRPSREREERDIYEQPKWRWTEHLPEIPTEAPNE